MNPIAQAAVKAITKLRPNIQDGYLRQRAAEDASARLTIASPRFPIRVFTPLDIDFSLRNGLHVNEDFEGTILFFHGGGFANGDIDFYTDTCMKMALKLNRRVVSVDYRRSPEYKFPAALVDCHGWRHSCL